MYYPIIKEESGEAWQNLEKSLELENLKINGIYSTSEETGRWSLSDVKFKNIHDLKKLKKLEINGISMEDLKGIKNLENLETFKLINPKIGPIANIIKMKLESVKFIKLLTSWMLIIVIEKPIQFTIVKAVPLSLEGAFRATKVENKGESAITTIPQKIKKAIKRYSL